MKIFKHPVPSTFTVVFLIQICSYGQTTEKKDAPETKGWKRGFSFGIGQSNFSIKEKNWRGTNYRDSLTGINSSGVMYNDLGVLLQYQFNASWGIRTKLQLSFGGGRLSIHKNAGEEKLKKELAYLGLPVYICASKSINTKTSLYFIGGPNPRFKLGDKQEDKRDFPTNNFIFAGDLGLGLAIMTKSAVVSPEITYSHGFTNILGTSNTLVGNVLSSIKTRAFYFSILFRSK